MDSQQRDEPGHKHRWGEWHDWWQGRKLRQCRICYLVETAER